MGEVEDRRLVWWREHTEKVERSEIWSELVGFKHKRHMGGQKDISIIELSSEVGMIQVCGSLPFMVSFVLCEVEDDNKRVRRWLSGTEERSGDFK